MKDVILLITGFLFGWLLTSLQIINPGIFILVWERLKTIAEKIRLLQYSEFRVTSCSLHSSIGLFEYNKWTKVTKKQLFILETECKNSKVDYEKR